jgi:hypothetical protein
MKLNIVSWNSTTDINNGSTYSAWYELKQQFIPTRSGVYSERPGKWQKLSGASMDTHNFVFKVRCLSTIHSQRETVKGWFSSEDYTAHKMVFEDTADSNRQWYLEGIPTKVTEESPGVLAITLATDEPYLRSVLSSTATISITTDGQKSTTDIYVVGNTHARPIIKLTANTAKAGDFGYSRWVTLYNQDTDLLPKNFSAYPLDFGGLDTKALISANKMQADGLDYLLEVDGHIVDRWFGTTDGRGINTTDTAMWGIINLAPKIELTLKTAINSTETVARVDFNFSSGTFQKALMRLRGAKNKVFLIGSEAYSYSEIHSNRFEAYADVTERGAYGTSQAGHNVGNKVIFLEHNIWQIYGSSDYTAAAEDFHEINNDDQPMFDLHSTNLSRVYSSFFQGGKNRPGAWTPQVNGANSAKSNFYTATQKTYANPATAMGGIIMSYFTSAWKPGKAGILWSLNDPGGVKRVEAAVTKYRLHTSWPADVGLEYQDPTTAQWIRTDDQSTPSSTGSWDSTTIESTDTGFFAKTAYKLRFIFSGTVAGVANNKSAFEVNSCTLTKSSSDMPVVSVGAEQSSYLLSARITNNTNGEWIKIRAVVALGRAVTINCDAKTITYADGTNLRAGLTLSSTRADWLTLEPGYNEIKYNETGVVSVTATFDWENRNTL